MRTELHRACLIMSHDPRYRCTVEDSWERPEPANRLQIAEKFLRSDADYMLQIDADTWPYHNLLPLMETGLDVIALPYPILRQNQTSEPPIVISLTPLDDTRVISLDGTMQEVARGGGGGFMVHRRVFESGKLETPWFMYGFDDVGHCTMGADVRFYDVVRRAGYQVWAATGHILGHSKEVDLVELARSVQEWKVK